MPAKMKDHNIFCLGPVALSVNISYSKEQSFLWSQDSQVTDQIFIQRQLVNELYRKKCDSTFFGDSTVTGFTVS